VFLSIQDTLKRLRETAMERFLTTPFEEREKAEQINNLNVRLTSNQTIIARLEKELNDAVAERDIEVSSIDDALLVLRLSPTNLIFVLFACVARFC
jgi:hypothetical protein